MNFLVIQLLLQIFKKTNWEIDIKLYMKKIWLFRPDSDDGLKITTALSKMFDVGLITSNITSKKKIYKK